MPRCPPITPLIIQSASFRCFSVYDNGFAEVLHCPELVVPSGEISYKVAQRNGLLGIPQWVEFQSFSTEANGRVEILHLARLIVPRYEVQDCSKIVIDWRVKF